MQDLSSPTRGQIHAPLQWKLKVLTTELPGNSPFFFRYAINYSSFAENVICADFNLS